MTSLATLGKSWFKDRTGVIGVALIIAASLAIAAATAIAVTTSAARNDKANINLNNISIPTFAVGVIDPDRRVAEASVDVPLPLLVDNGAQLIPGGTATASLNIFNNSETLFNTISARITTVGDGTVTIDGTAHPNITKFLRFTVVDAAGAVLVDNVAIDDAVFTLPTLRPRGAPAVPVGEVLTSVPVGTYALLRIRIDYIDDPETRDYLTGLSALTLVLDSTSARS